MRSFYLPVCALGLLLCISARALDLRASLAVDGTARAYLVHVPPSYDGTKAFPLVLIFHGGLRNAESAKASFGFDPKSDREGFIAVYPEGLPLPGHHTAERLFWNCSQSHFTSSADDVKFTGAVLDDVESRFLIDKNRVFATGLSAGAQFSYRLACALASRIAAIAPVAGSLETAPCEPSEPVSILDIHGTGDHFVPYDGNGILGYHSVPWTMDAVTHLDGCSSAPTHFTLPATVDDGTRIESETYEGRARGVEVKALIVENGGHNWPGIPIRYPDLLGVTVKGPLRWRLQRKMLGIVSENLSATDAIWDFFKAHPKNP